MKNIFTKTRIAIGGFLMFMGLMFASPPFDMIPNDFLNIFTAIFIVSFGFVDKLSALFFTYTIIPIILFSVGVFIYPVTGSRVTFVVKTFRKLVKGYLKFLKKPRNLVISLALFIVLYYFYSKLLIPLI